MTWHGGRMIAFLALVAVMALVTVGWARNADQRISRQQHETCELLRLVAMNQLFVLQHHLSASTSIDEQRDIIRRIELIRRVQKCDGEEE